MLLLTLSTDAIIFTKGTLLADYKWSLRGIEGSARDEAKRACHARGADRLQRLCFANGGIYIKLGQHVAQLVRARAFARCKSKPDKSTGMAQLLNHPLQQHLAGQLSSAVDPALAHSAKPA